MNSKGITRMGLIFGIFVCIAASGFFNVPSTAQENVQPETPEKYFGFYPGTDRKIFAYETLLNYFQKLETTSPRIKVEKIGLSPMGKPMVIVFISAAENIKNLAALKEINRKLALDAELSDTERTACFEQGKVFVLGTLSMHSDEIAPATASPLIAYDLAVTQDPQKLKCLEDVVYMMVPNHNPDGMDMVVEHYQKYKGTKYEGCPLPNVYHKYVGHDNNRDFVTLSQSDTKAIAALFNLDWFPQVMVEKHQMGYRGPRYYVPINHDPIAEIIDAGIWNWIGIFGSNLMKDMTGAGLAGVSQHYLFDNYWTGSTETCIWKNVIGFLTEAASVKVASPIFIEANELTVEGKGLSEYKKSVNMPLPWPGGWWHLADIVQYEVVSTLSILQTAAQHRVDILRFRNDLCKKEVLSGHTQPPFYYILPIKQHDQSEWVVLVNLLIEHGITVCQLTQNTVIAGQNYAKGDIVVPMSQPFRPFIKEVLEPQEYPLRHYTPNGEIIKPYDITTWSLPLHFGVSSVTVNRKDQLPTDFQSLLQKIDSPFTLSTPAPENFSAAILTVTNNESYKAAFTAIKEGFTVTRLKKAVVLNQVTFNPGSFIISGTGKNNSALKKFLKELSVTPIFLENTTTLETQPVKIPRIALVETYFHDMDAGWTRFVLDSYAIPFKIIHPGEFETLDLSKNYDMLIFPDSIKSILLDGKDKSGDDYRISALPPEFARGMGEKGLEKVFIFLDNGGMILSWGNSTEIFMGMQKMTLPNLPKEEFQLPVSNIAAKIEKSGLYCPGSLMKLDLVPGHPLTLGLPEQIGIFYRGKHVFRTIIPERDMDRRVIGKFPEKDILLSGYCENQEKVGNQSALVWLKKNKGQLVLCGFSPIFRASTHVSYKLLFNTILLPPLQ